MFEPWIVNKELQYSCDMCGDIPIVGRRRCCNVCEDYDLCEGCWNSTQRMRERGAQPPGPHSPDHAMTVYDVSATTAPVHSGSLKAVMADAVQRWFIDTLRNARNGDMNQAALLAEMLAEGYGCVKDLEEARYWKQVASNGGARRVDGVYDKLP